MKMRLAYRLSLSLLLTIVVIAALMVCLQFYLLRSFSDYVNRVQLDKLETLEASLRDLHDREGGWTALRRDPQRWRALLESAGIEMALRFPRLGPGERIGGGPFDEGAPPRPGERPEGGPFGEGAAPGPPDSRLPPPEPRRPPLPPPGQFPIGPRLSLLDAHQDRVAGDPEPGEGLTLKPIESGGRTIGWLGLPRRRVPEPLAEAFLDRQSRFFLWTGAAALVLTTLVSLAVSRQILGPVSALADGTQALIARRFQKRIAVSSTDELGQLARDFNNLARTLEQYEALRRQWLTDISHELRTPLSILRGEIEALQDGVRKPDDGTLASLHTEVIRLGRLVDDLHLLSLADSGSLQMQSVPVDPLAVLGETLALYRHRLEERGLRLELDLRLPVPPIVEADPDRLKQVFSNLLDNTLRHADAPGVVRLSARGAAGTLTICLEDSGPGVPPESMGRLFDRLYRVDRSRTRESGGSGLGLAICRQLVEACNGTILAERSPLGGLAVRMTLPRRDSVKQPGPDVGGRSMVAP